MLHGPQRLDVVTQAQTVDAFGAGLVGDYPRYTAGCAVLETADRLVAEEGEPALRVYLLVVGAIRALADRERDASLVLDAFLLRAMTHAGWAPAITTARAAPRRARTGRSASRAGERCARGAARRARSHPAPETSGSSTRCCTATGRSPTRPARRSVARRSGLVAAHLQWHLERAVAVAAAGGAAATGGAGVARRSTAGH